MANLRRLVGTVVKWNGEPWAGARVVIRLLTDAATQPAEVYPILQQKFRVNNLGEVPDGIFLATPDTEAWRYQLQVQDNEPIWFYLSGTGDISLEALFALAGQPGVEPGNPEWEWLNTIYSSAGTADDGQVLTADGLGGAAFEDVPGVGVVDYIDFNTAYVNGVVEGRLQWSADDGTLEVGLPGGDVNLQIGQEMLVRVRNISGGVILNGQPVAIVGAATARPTVVLADASDPALAFPCGVATEEIADNQTGYVTVFGLVRDINTNAWAEGEKLFLSTTAGELTTTRPLPPLNAVCVAVVLRQSATEGVLLVKPTPFLDSGDFMPKIATAVAGNIPLILADGTLEDGGVSPADFDPAGSAAAAAAASIPKIAPAVAGNLVVQRADGTLAGAGYAADVNATAGSVVRRTVGGRIFNDTTGISIQANSVSQVAISGFSENSTGIRSETGSGTYHHAFGTVSAIARTTGVLTFIGANAATDRLAQTNEINAVSYGAAQTLTAPQQAQARTNIGAETSGASATVQGNLTAHENLTTTAHGGIVASADPRLTDARTPTAHAASHATAGSDPISPASIGAAPTVHTHTASQISDSGATGRSVLQAATVDTARGVLGLAQIALPVIQKDHALLGGWTTASIVGSTTFAISNSNFFQCQTGTTAGSSGRYRTADNMPLNRGSVARFARWGNQIVFAVHFGNVITNAEGEFRVLFGKLSTDAIGTPATGNYVGFLVQNTTISTGYVCKAGVLTPVALTPTARNWLDGLLVYIVSNNGTVSWYANNALIGSTTEGPTAQTAGTINYEIANGATAANYRHDIQSWSYGY